MNTYTVTNPMLDFIRAEVNAMERSKDINVVRERIAGIRERFSKQFPECPEPELAGGAALLTALAERAAEERAMQAQAAPGQPIPPDKEPEEPPEPAEST